MPKKALYAFYLWDDDDYLVGLFTAHELARYNGTRVNSVHHQICQCKKNKRPIWLGHRIKCRVYIYYEPFNNRQKKLTEAEEIEKSIKEYKALYKSRHSKEKEKTNEKNNEIVSNGNDVV